MKTEFICSQCEQTKENDSNFTTGYGLDNKGNKVCYACCGINDKQALINAKPGDKFTHYLTKKDGRYTVSNWPGSMQLNVSYADFKKYSGGFGAPRTDVWFTVEGKQFWGVSKGWDNEVVRIKALKA